VILSQKFFHMLSMNQKILLIDLKV